MVITDVNQVVYLGDGVTTAFPFTFRIIDATDVKLLLIDADGTETDITSDYFVDTVNSTVHYPGYAPGAEPGLADQPAPVQTGQRLVIYRELPITQEKDLGDKWPFFVIELALDKLTMILQQIYGWWGRTLKFGVGWQVDHPNFDTSIPIEAGKTWRVNDAGTGFVAAGDPDAAVAVAQDAKDTADAAALVAQTAKSTADGIAGTANAALTAAGIAVNTANTASSTATNAKNTADGIAGTANSALNTANSAATDASSALAGLLTKATWFDTVYDMKGASLTTGTMAATKGYYSANDGGGACYLIRSNDSDTDNGGSIIVLDNGNVAELITGNVVNVKQYGAIGNGTHNDSVAINNALKDSIGKTVYFPAGTYLCASYSITVYSCTKMLGDKGKTILQRGYNTATDGTAVLLHSLPIGAETTIHDITIQNMILDGNGTVYDQRGFDLTYFADYPVNNFIIENCDFLNVIDYHAIDLTQCSHTIIRNCRFMGWELMYETDSAASQREAIQFDAYSNTADDTRDNHVLIENCYFGASDDFRAYPCAVGNHGFAETGDTTFFNNVIITGCHFKGMRFYAIHLYIYQDVVIENNHCDGGKFLNIGNRDVNDSVYCNKNIVVQNNNVVGQAGTYFANAIYCNSFRSQLVESTFADAATTNIVIRNNFFKYFTKCISLSGNGVNGAIVEGNAFEHCGDDASNGNSVYAYTAIKSLKVLNNIFRNCGSVYLFYNTTDLSSFTDKLALMTDVIINGNSFIDTSVDTRAIHVIGEIRGVIVCNNVINDSATTRPASYSYIAFTNVTGGDVKGNYIYTKSAMTAFYDITTSTLNTAENYNYINNVLNSVAGNEYLPLSGGTMTGTIVRNGVFAKNVADGSSFTMYGGSDTGKGAEFAMFGKDHGSNPGLFRLTASDGVNTRRFIGKPDGTLTWDGQPIQTSSDKRLKQDFADVSDDIIKAWGKVKWQQYKFKADAETKENARYHVGLVAQDVEESVKNILDYGILCHDKETDMWTIRYEEALCMEAEYQRRKVSALEKRIKTLENKLKKLTQNE